MILDRFKRLQSLIKPLLAKRAKTFLSTNIKTLSKLHLYVGLLENSIILTAQIISFISSLKIENQLEFFLLPVKMETQVPLTMKSTVKFAAQNYRTWNHDAISFSQKLHDNCYRRLSFNTIVCNTGHLRLPQIETNRSKVIDVNQTSSLATLPDVIKDWSVLSFSRHLELSPSWPFHLESSKTLHFVAPEESEEFNSKHRKLVFIDLQLTQQSE